MKFARVSNKAKWILALSCGLALAIPLVWLELRQWNSAQRIYRIGFDNQPPQHFAGKDGKPTGLIVELIEEAQAPRYSAPVVAGTGKLGSGSQDEKGRPVAHHDDTA